MKLKEHEFKILSKGWHWDSDCYLWYKLSSEKLDSEKIVHGPPIKLESFVNNFKKKYKKTFIKDNHVFAKIKRKFAAADSLLKLLLKDKHVKTFISSLRKL